LRKARDGQSIILSVSNMTPVPRPNYRIGVPRPGFWQEILNTNALIYGGDNMGNAGGALTEEIPAHHQSESVSLAIPPLSTILLKWEPR
jgi:1,4-alpha-glucan branching enzyme